MARARSLGLASPHVSICMSHFHSLPMCCGGRGGLSVQPPQRLVRPPFPRTHHQFDSLSSEHTAEHARERVPRRHCVRSQRPLEVGPRETRLRLGGASEGTHETHPASPRSPLIPLRCGRFISRAQRRLGRCCPAPPRGSVRGVASVCDGNEAEREGASLGSLTISRPSSCTGTTSPPTTRSRGRGGGCGPKGPCRARCGRDAA